jgi:hypothetical protein
MSDSGHDGADDECRQRQHDAFCGLLQSGSEAQTAAQVTAITICIGMVQSRKYDTHP